MGLYINPQNMTKEQFLELNGTEVHGPVPAPENHALICLVANAAFTAAAWAYCESERQAFHRPDDYRPKRWFHVPTSTLIGTMPDGDYARGMAG